MSNSSKSDFDDSSHVSHNEAADTHESINEKPSAGSEIVTAPNAPTIYLISNDGRTAVVGWKIDEPDKVQSFRVLLQVKGKEIEIDVHALETIFDDLEPGCLYGVCVCAKVEGESGPYSQLLTFPSAPLPPNGVQVVHNPLAPEKSVFVKFSDPDPRQKDYVINIDDLAFPGSDTRIEVTKKTTVAIGELKSDSLYKVCVQTRIKSTLKEELLMSSRAFCDREVQTYPAQTGELKKEEISRGSCKISWDTVLGAEKYRIRWKSDKTGHFNECETVDNYLVLDNLDQGTSYVVTVAAVNATGSGNRSIPLHFNTAPCPPDDLKVRRYESSPDTALIVSFADPSPPDKNYRVVAQPLSLKEDVIIETSKCLALLKNLMPGETYNVYVESVDSISGRTSEKTYFSGLAQTCPAEVRGLEAQVLQDTCLQLTWEPLELTPLRYHIAVNVNGQDMSPEFTEKTSFVLSNLTPSSTYIVAVAAENAAGSGKFCHPKECRTRPAGPLKVIAKKCPANPTSTLTVWVEDNDLVRKQYRVEARDPKNVVARSVLTWEKYAVLGDLISGTPYRINVVAIDRELESDPVWLSQL